MFTDADFVSYFAELEMFERTMRDVYDAAIAEIADPEIKRMLISLRNSEEVHARMVEKLRQIAIAKTMKGA